MQNESKIKECNDTRTPLPPTPLTQFSHNSLGKLSEER